MFFSAEFDAIVENVSIGSSKYGYCWIHVWNLFGESTCVHAYLHIYVVHCMENIRLYAQLHERNISVTDVACIFMLQERLFSLSS